MIDGDPIAEGRKILAAVTSDYQAAYEWMRNNLPAIATALEAAQRPPLGYGVVNIRYGATALMPGIYDTLDVATERAGRSHALPGVRYVVAELREVKSRAAAH